MPVWATGELNHMERGNSLRSDGWSTCCQFLHLPEEKDASPADPNLYASDANGRQCLLRNNQLRFAHVTQHEILYGLGRNRQRTDSHGASDIDAAELALEVN